MSRHFPPKHGSNQFHCPYCNVYASQHWNHAYYRDVIAVIELVKNSYDAYPRNVHLRFCENPKDGLYLEILNDGCGMARDTIEGIWCLVAPTHRQKNPVAKNGQHKFFDTCYPTATLV